MSETLKTCPLGHTCDQCLWQVEHVTEDVTTGQVRVDKMCAVVAQVHLAQHIYRETNSVGSTIDKFRHETTQGQAQLTGIFQGALGHDT